MDPRYSSMHLNQSLPVYPDRGLDGPSFEYVFPDQQIGGGVARSENDFVNHKFGGVQFLPSDPLLSTTVTNSNIIKKDDYNEDCDLSDAVLTYISQMLMEEDMEEKSSMLHESLDLQAKEKSFYDVLGKKYPPSPEPNPFYVLQNGNVPDDYFSGNQSNWTTSSSNYSDYLFYPNWINSLPDCNHSDVPSLPTCSQLSISSSNSRNNNLNGLVDSPVSPVWISEIYTESQSIWQFKKGVEEASKFLPSGSELLLNLDVKELLNQKRKGEISIVVDTAGEKDKAECSLNGWRGKKNSCSEDVDIEEGRSRKLAAVSTESTVRSKDFDLVLLSSMGEGKAALQSYQETLRNSTNKNIQQNGELKGSGKGKHQGKKQNRKKEVVDLRTLLISCAQAVAAGDGRTANELLKQIRLHSSPFGDGNQRIAQYFANGLEARLAGTGSAIYKAIISKTTTAADYLKAYHLYLASCPFRKISNFASNKTINMKAENSMRVHIIDFGILYGFQWPTFIQRIAERKGGPPKLRITGIDFPQPGFRPAERIEETGRRIADYARSFNVPLEYKAVANHWQNIKVEDLKIDKDEFIVVNCLYRCENLFDETVILNSPRNILIKLIRKINPDIFIHGIVNGAYSAPFFVTRFKEALFHFSALFDMLETNVPRENCERMIIEREIFGREAMNVIACEGWERVERPETYKQWQVRNLKAGFTQIPFHREIITRAKEKVSSGYQEDFLIDEDNQWLLQGWKGRIIYALSCWKPVYGT